MNFAVESNGLEIGRFHTRLAAQWCAKIESVFMDNVIVRDLDAERIAFEEARRKQREAEASEQKRRHAAAVKAYEEEQERKRAHELAEASRIDWQKMKDEADARWNYKKPKESPRLDPGWYTGMWPSSCGYSGHIGRGDVTSPPWSGGDR